MFYYEVAVPAPLEGYLTYSSLDKLERGQLVELALRNKKTKGIVMSEVSKPSFKTKELTCLDFRLDRDHLKWLEWLAQYYLYPAGLVIHSVFPPLDFKESKKKDKSPELEEPLALTSMQLQAVKELNCFDRYKASLLHGVTGSGKTEIYLELFEEVIHNRKQQGLFLLPEISLTPQLEKRFKKRFGDLVATYHSQLTPRQKTNSWYKFMNQEAKILIGPRSALFCPSPNIGLIVVDEEHESSFKQEEKFLYSAKNAAMKLAQIKNIPIVLGSATPSLETLYNVQRDKVSSSRIKEKVFQQDPPQVQVVDMTKEESPDPFWMSSILEKAIENHLAQKKQVALFLNRRGWSAYVQCYDCGHNFKCLNCDISLTLHHQKDLFCHYCGYGERLPETCPDCGSEKLHNFGLGTEQIYKDLEKKFSNARILKFDRDEIHTKNQLKEAIEKIEKEEVDIIIGTQMISKGLDFNKLTLMGIVDVDQSFSFPDFRSTEKSVQQVHQVLGRVGRRKGQKAEVIIQTRSPEHPIFNYLDERNYEDLALEQLHKRAQFNYPPHVRLVSFLIRSPELAKAMSYAEKINHYSVQLQKKWPSYSQVGFLGPVTAPIEKIRNEYRVQFFMKFPLELSHSVFINELKRALGKLPVRVKLSINVDPLDLM